MSIIKYIIGCTNQAKNEDLLHLCILSIEKGKKAFEDCNYVPAYYHLLFGFMIVIEMRERDLDYGQTIKIMEGVDKIIFYVSIFFF